MTTSCISAAFYRDLKAANKAASDARKDVVLCKLTKTGEVSKMHDATMRFTTEIEAMEYVARVRSLNPARVLRYQLNGTEVAL